MTPQFQIPTKPKKSAGGTRTAPVFREPAAPQEPAVPPEDISRSFQGRNPGHRREGVWLTFSKMLVDPTYQRAENQAEIRHIAANHRPAALGTPVLSAREDAAGNVTFWVLDGQQRRAGSLLAGYDEVILCDVHYGLTAAEEAQLFLDLNFRKDVAAGDKFRAALAAEEEEALAIKAVLDSLDIKLGDPRGFTAVAKARALVRKKNGLAQFHWALATLQRVYDTGSGGVYDGRLVDGFATFIRHHDGKFTQTDLEKKLRTAGRDTTDLINDANTLRDVHRYQVGTAVANTIIRYYNVHRSKNKLPWIGLNGGPEDADTE